MIVSNLTGTLGQEDCYCNSVACHLLILEPLDTEIKLLSLPLLLLLFLPHS